jgi:CBS domain-containing protein
LPPKADIVQVIPAASFGAVLTFMMRPTTTPWGMRPYDMPVLDKERLAGLVSIGDALKWQIETRTNPSIRSVYC